MWRYRDHRLCYQRGVSGLSISAAAVNPQTPDGILNVFFYETKDCRQEKLTPVRVKRKISISLSGAGFVFAKITRLNSHKNVSVFRPHGCKRGSLHKSAVCRRCCCCCCRRRRRFGEYSCCCCRRHGRNPAPKWSVVSRAASTLTSDLVSSSMKLAHGVKQ